MSVPSTTPVAGITPEPTEEEAVAIAAAVVAGLPTGNGEQDTAPAPPRWRFSGRWWSAPVSVRRARP